VKRRRYTFVIWKVVGRFMERHHISEHIYGKLGCEEQI